MWGPPVTGVRAAFDDAELRTALRRLAETGGLTPALKTIGEHLVSSTQARFERVPPRVRG